MVICHDAAASEGGILINYNSCYGRSKDRLDDQQVFFQLAEFSNYSFTLCVRVDHSKSVSVLVLACDRSLARLDSIRWDRLDRAVEHVTDSHERRKLLLLAATISLLLQFE